MIRRYPLYRPDGLRRIRKVFLQLCMLCLLGILCACGRMVDLQSGLKDDDANEIVSVLNRYGIEAHKSTTKNGVVLRVDEKDISRATEALNAAGLPRRNLASLGQVFKKEGMISTPLEERARYIHGLSAELEYTLQQFDQVLTARVHVVLPERVAPGEPIQPSSAAVFVKYRPPLDEDTLVPRIRNLVASSIPGLSGEGSRNKVSVVLAASEIAPPPVEWTTIGPFQVMADSAAALVATLAALAVLSLGGAALGLMHLARENEKFAGWLKKYAGKVPALSGRTEN